MRKTKKIDLAWYGQALLTQKLLPLSEWSERYVRLLREESNESGRWSNSRFPFQRGIMDALTNPQYEAVVFVAPTQVGKSRIALNWIGSIIHQDPGPVLFVVPDINLASEFSTQRFQPMIRDMPVLRGKIRETRGKQAKEEGAVNKTLAKSFPGGRIKFVGSNSETGMSSTPTRYVYFDELDRCDPSAGAGGDQVVLTRRRTDRFYNRKLFYTGSPGLKATSRTMKFYDQSNKCRFYLPCPHCDHMQLLLWENFKWDKAESGMHHMQLLLWENFKWDKAESGMHLAHTAHFICVSCHQKIEEKDKEEMLQRGEWRAERPEECNGPPVGGKGVCEQ